MPSNAFKSHGKWTEYVDNSVRYVIQDTQIPNAIFCGLFFLASITIATWGFLRVRKQCQITQAIFRWKFPLVMIFNIIIYGWMFAEQVFLLSVNNIREVFFLFDALMTISYFLAQVGILWLLYIMIGHLFYPSDSNLGQSSSDTRRRNFLYAHYAFCGLLIIFGVVTWALNINKTVKGSNQALEVEDITAFRDVKFTFEALTLLSAVEILGFVSSFGSSHTSSSGDRFPKQTRVKAVCLIGLPIFTGVILIVVRDAIYEFGDPFERPSYSSYLRTTATAIFWHGFGTSVLPLVGLILISQALDKRTQEYEEMFGVNAKRDGSDFTMDSMQRESDDARSSEHQHQQNLSEHARNQEMMA